VKGIFTQKQIPTQNKNVIFRDKVFEYV